MKKNFVRLIIFFFIFLFSCSGPSSLYNFDFPLTSDVSVSRTTELQVNIPRGWFTAEDNKDEKIDLWLIKDDYSATISFVRINPDEETLNSSSQNALKKIKEYSKLNNQLAHRDKFIDLLKNESFEVNDMDMEVYQFAGSKYLYRVVVIPYKNVYYECSASIVPGQSKEEITKVFTTQNSVLQSIK